VPGYPTDQTGRGIPGGQGGIECQGGVALGPPHTRSQRHRGSKFTHSTLQNASIYNTINRPEGWFQAVRKHRSGVQLRAIATGSRLNPRRVKAGSAFAKTPGGATRSSRKRGGTCASRRFRESAGHSVDPVRFRDSERRTAGGKGKDATRRFRESMGDSMECAQALLLSRNRRGVPTGVRMDDQAWAEPSPWQSAVALPYWRGGRLHGRSASVAEGRSLPVVGGGRGGLAECRGRTQGAAPGGGSG
jgi:hypothetical protein